jgi:transcriptional regulator with XRE-family HTH domain
MCGLHQKQDFTRENEIMPQAQPPVISRRQIRTFLKNRRIERGETQQQVADAFGWSAAKVMRIETGKSPVTVSDITALLSHYGVTDPAEVARLQDLARKARPGLGKKYGAAISDKFREFLEYEEAAQSIRMFEANFIPGPLQTEEYARAVLTEYVEPGSEGNIEVRVQARLERQEMLLHDGAPEAAFIVDEAALRRRVGTEMRLNGVMERQLRHLSSMSALPNVQIQIVPFSAGLYSPYRVPFVILDLDDTANPRLVYLETHHNEIILYDSEDEVQPYLDAFSRMQRLGTDPSRLSEIVQNILNNPVKDIKA